MKNQRGLATAALSKNDEAIGEFTAAILSFLFADPQRSDAFLRTTGFDVGALRDAAADPGFAESVLDYLCADEPLLVAFARENGYEPAAIEATRQRIAAQAPDF